MKIVTIRKRIGCNMNDLRQTACIVAKLIIGDGFASLLHWKAVCRACSFGLRSTIAVCDTVCRACSSGLRSTIAV